MQDEKSNLFIYGSLRDPAIFQSVCGHSFTLRPSNTDPENLLAELALLPNYRKVSPDNVYFYAVPDKTAKIEGFIIYDIPAQAMTEIDRYEGKIYKRETVEVNTALGLIEANSYLASQKSMRLRFGDRFHVNLIHELWLRKRIEKFFKEKTRPGESSLDADIERRAKRELLATTERDLVMSHLGSEAVSDFYLEHELDRPCPSIKYLHNEPSAHQFMDSYLALVVKQVILNQFEHKIQSRYRFELDRLASQRYFTRSISLLVALRMINSNKSAIDSILGKALETMPPTPAHDLIDYVKYAISAAETIFDARVARSEIQRIRTNRRPGLMPLGAELELSNLGFKAIHAQDEKNTDYIFDGFKYFDDFKLNILSWKLGGYIDDHTDTTGFRKRGFLELAPGRLNILGELSKPATADPWIMNQLIREITDFYPVKPHSLHLSFQIRKKHIPEHKVLPLSFVKCLFALGGGTQQRAGGRLWVSRMAHDEIKQKTTGEELVFSRVSKRRSRLVPDDIDQKPPAFTTTYVQQYKFIRLEERANYEPLIMALKGLQIAYNPGDYLTDSQLKKSKGLHRKYDELKIWAENPTPISLTTKRRFLQAVQKGLMAESHGRPRHKLHYIDWAIGALDIQLRLFNKQLQKPPAHDPLADLKLRMAPRNPYKI